MSIDATADETKGEMPIRVIVLTPWFPSCESPRSGNYIGDQVSMLANKTDLQICVLHRAGWCRRLRRLWSCHHERHEVEGFPILRLWVRDVGWGTANRAIADLATITSLWSLQRAYGKAKLIHAHTVRTVRPARIHHLLTRTPYVVTEHLYEFLAGELTAWERRDARRAFPQARLVIAVSRALKDAVLKVCPETEVVVIPNVVAPPGFSLGLGRCSEQILFVGRLERVKGADILVDAVAELPASLPWRLIIVGKGSQQQALETAVRSAQLSDRVDFLGERPRAEVAALMRECAVVVVPSRYETFCCVAVEAALCGATIIGSDVGGVGEVLRDLGSGTLVPPGDTRALRSAIVSVLRSAPNTGQQFAAAASARARYSPGVVGPKIVNAYKQASSPALPVRRSARKLR